MFKKLVGAAVMTATVLSLSACAFFGAAAKEGIEEAKVEIAYREALSKGSLAFAKSSEESDKVCAGADPEACRSSLDDMVAAMSVYDDELLAMKAPAGWSAEHDAYEQVIQEGIVIMGEFTAALDSADAAEIDAQLKKVQEWGTRSDAVESALFDKAGMELVDGEATPTE